MLIKELLRRIKMRKLKFLSKKNKKIIIEKIEIQLDNDVQISNDCECLIRGLTMNKNCSLRIREKAKLDIGKEVYFNNACVLTCRKYIKIGNNTSFAPNVIIFDHNHDYKNKDVSYNNNYICNDIIIGDNVWVGANTVILAGTKIGNNCVIGAGSVVKGEIPTNTLFYNKRINEMKKIEKL